MIRERSLRSEWILRGIHSLTILLHTHHTGALFSSWRNQKRKVVTWTAMALFIHSYMRQQPLKWFVVISLQSVLLPASWCVVSCIWVGKAVLKAINGLILIEFCLCIPVVPFPVIVFWSDWLHSSVFAKLHSSLKIFKCTIRSIIIAFVLVKGGLFGEISNRLERVTKRLKKDMDGLLDEYQVSFFQKHVLWCQVFSPGFGCGPWLLMVQWR